MTIEIDKETAVTEVPVIATEIPVTVSETPIAEPVIALHTEVPSLLEGVGKVEEIAKQVEAEPTTGEVKGEVKTEPTDAGIPDGEKKATVEKEPIPETKLEPVPEPVYEFNLPEGFTADQEKLSTYKETLKTHNIAPEVGQQLLEMHTSAIQQLASNTLAQQHEAFAAVRKGWRDAVMADEQLGGAGHQTAMASVARMRDAFVPAEDRPAFDEFLRITGAGDHPAFLKVLYNAARMLDEPIIPSVSGKPVPQPKGPGGRRAVLYDHPTSQRTGR